MFLSEHLVASPVAEAITDDARRQQRYSDWQQATGEKIDKRLKWSELERRRVDAILDMKSPAAVSPEELPAWTTRLVDISDRVAKQEFDPANPDSHPDHQRPFGHLLHPIAEFARKNLRSQMPASFPEMTDEARTQLEQSILPPLEKLYQSTLLHEFDLVRPAGRRLLGSLIEKLPGDRRRDQYLAFVLQHLHDGLMSLFERYPVLARLTVSVVENWSTATSEFLNRLESDLGKIAEVLAGCDRRELGRICRVEMGLSDPHNGSRQVHVLCFESGYRVVYKPKSLGIATAYQELLSWINEQSGEQWFRPVPLIDCSSYGWMSYIESQSPTDDGPSPQFYRNAGRLLAVLHLLGATDCHWENIISDGTYPHLVDHETLLTHRLRAPEDVVEVDTAARSEFVDSVLRTAFLPRWVFLSEDYSWLEDSLGVVKGRVFSRMKVPSWRAVNSDDMCRVMEQQEFRNDSLTLPAEETDNDSVDSVKGIVDGFEQSYRFLLEYRKSLAADDGPLARFRSQPVRIVIRDTRVYATLLNQLLTPATLRSGIDFGIQLDALSRAYLRGDFPPPTWPLLAEELSQMQRLDIPCFFSTTGSTKVAVKDNSCVVPMYEDSSFEEMQSRLAKMDESDLWYQLSVIHGAYWGLEANADRTAQQFGDASHSRRLPPDELTAAAAQIGRQIVQRAIQGPDGDRNWLGYVFFPASQRVELRPLGDTLFDGRCGIALFLTALQSVQPIAEAEQTIDSALEFIRDVLGAETSFEGRGEAIAVHWAKELGIGGTQGLGSVIYCLTAMARISSSAADFEAAKRACDLLTEEDICADEALDLMGGAAGALLCLLSLYEHSGYETALAKAVCCGDRLLDTRGVKDGQAWKTIGQREQTGFSHGAAGISYALLRLFQITGNPAYLEAAEQGIEFEARNFVKERGNWLDFRGSPENDAEPQFYDSWCNGASGIGLGRLAGLDVLDNDQIRSDIAAALNADAQRGLTYPTHLCCGLAGHIEFLMEAADRLERPELLAEAHRRGAAIVESAQSCGYYQLYADMPPSIFAPMFFQGIAGVGYTLLRLAHPGRFPAVTLLR